MKPFEPTFQVSETTSMQWNRTMQVRILDSEHKFEQASHTIDVPPEVLNKIRDAIRTQIADLRGDLDTLTLSVELSKPRSK